MPEQKLRIAFATIEYVTEKPFDCGLATYLHRAGKRLAEMGHDIHILTLSDTDAPQFQHDGMTIHRLKVSRIWLELNRLTRYRLSTSIYLLGFSACVYRKLKELNRREAFDLAQFPYCPFCGLVSILFLRVPHVLRASWSESAWNDLMGTKAKLDARVVHLLERLQFRFSPRVCTPSWALREILRQRAGVKEVRVIPSPCYIETSDWDYSRYDERLKGKKYLLFFGRFELRKGFHILSEALPYFLAQHPEAMAVLVGRDLGSILAPSMAEYARSLLSAYPDRVLILDRLPHAQLYPIIEKAHLVVLPSLMDNLPNACLESMILGKVVLGTRGASFEEMISDGQTGFLVAPNSVEELSEKLVSVWADSRLEEIGRAARRRAADFAPEFTVSELVSYYYEVLGGSEPTIPSPLRTEMTS